MNSSDEEPKPKKKPSGRPKKTVAGLDDLSDEDVPKPKKPAPKKKALAKPAAMSDDEDVPKPKKKPGPKKTAAPKKKADSDSDDMFGDFNSVSRICFLFSFSHNICLSVSRSFKF